MRMGSSTTDAASHSSRLHACLALLLLLSAATLAECQTPLNCTVDPLTPGQPNCAQFPPSLNRTFYNTSCHNFTNIVTDILNATFQEDARMAASLLRLHFHDCWPNGCDASVLLDSTSTFESEKFAPQNNDSLRGFEVIDAIKAELEIQCPNTVSCADILTQAAEQAVVLAGGPGWPIAFGRRDSLTSAFDAAKTFLPTPNLTIPELIANFYSRGFNVTELVTLSGSHTFGRARCLNVIPRLYPIPEPDINPAFLYQLEENCPLYGNESVLNNLDLTTPDCFDNKYYINLQNEEGLLHSDQELYSTPGPTVDTVNLFASNNTLFRFAYFCAIIKMDNLSPLTGDQGEVRTNCRKVNSAAISEIDSTDITDPLLAFQ